MKKLKNNAWLEEGNLGKGEIDGFPYWIAKSPYGGLNGYLYFKKRPVREKGYDGILAYVPVHGGITYATGEKDGSIVYGFDTAHCDSHDFPRFNSEWIKGQLRIMLKGILKAKSVELKYLKAIKQNTKAKYADMVWRGEEHNNTYNFSILLNLLSGKL